MNRSEYDEDEPNGGNNDQSSQAYVDHNENENNNNNFEMGEGHFNNNSRNEMFQDTNLLPVTICQLNETPLPQQEEPFAIDGRPVSQVTFVGTLEKKEPASTHTSFTIDDGTGRIVVKIWSSNGDDILHVKFEKLKDHSYVRVIGRVSIVNQEKNITGFTIIPIEDFNEVTLHFFEVIYAHEYNMMLLNRWTTPHYYQAYFKSQQENQKQGQEQYFQRTQLKQQQQQQQQYQQYHQQFPFKQIQQQPQPQQTLQRSNMNNKNANENNYQNYRMNNSYNDNNNNNNNTNNKNMNYNNNDNNNNNHYNNHNNSIFRRDMNQQSSQPRNYNTK